VVAAYLQGGRRLGGLGDELCLSVEVMMNTTAAMTATSAMSATMRPTARRHGLRRRRRGAGGCNDAAPVPAS
jgi:hypothetical protein